jgi:hypothetical protein
MNMAKTAGGHEGALEFLKYLADAENTVTQVQKGDVERTVEIAKSRGYDIEVKDLWSAITDLQAKRTDLAGNVPIWIIDRLRVSVHD